MTLRGIMRRLVAPSIGILLSVGAARAQEFWARLPTGLTASSTNMSARYAPTARYGASSAPVAAQSRYLDSLRFWSTAFAGRSSVVGNSEAGTPNVTASILGTAFGADTQFDDATLAGVSVSTSRQTFSSGASRGTSADLALTAYARRSLFDNAYVTAALGYGWHTVETQRPGTILGYGILEAKYHTIDFGGRLEGGYTFTLDRNLLSPFGALVSDDYHQPAYAEAAVSGPSFYAASFAAKSISVTHMEWGLRYGRYFSSDDGKTFSLDATAAWEHELNDAPYVLASLLIDPGSSFAVYGTKPPPDTALLGLGFRQQNKSGLSFGMRADSRLGTGTTIISGTADLTYRW